MSTGEIIDYPQQEVMITTGNDTHHLDKEEFDELPPLGISIDEVIKIATSDNLKKIIDHLFHIETVTLYQLYHNENLIEIWYDEKYVPNTNTISKYTSIIEEILYADENAVYEFYVRDNITYYRNEFHIEYCTIKDMIFDCFNLMLRIIGIGFHVENYEPGIIVYKFEAIGYETLYTLTRPKYSKVGYAAKLMYKEFEKQDPKILDFKIITSDSELLLHSAIIFQVTQGIIKTLLDSSSIEAKTNEITFRDYDTDMIKIYIKYLYFSSDDLSSVLTFNNIFEEIKMIDSVLNFANFLDDIDFFNTIVKYIMELPVKRHVNILFQYRDIQSHNAIFQEYLSILKIKSERDSFPEKCKKIQELYTTKLEFIGLFFGLSRRKRLIVFRTQEYGIISIVLESLNKSRRKLYSIIEEIGNLSGDFLIKIDHKKEKRSGALVVPNLKEFLKNLHFSTFNILEVKYDISYRPQYKIIQGNSHEKILEKYYRPDGNNLTSFHNFEL